MKKTQYYLLGEYNTRAHLKYGIEYYISYLPLLTTGLLDFTDTRQLLMPLKMLQGSYMEETLLVICPDLTFSRLVHCRLQCVGLRIYPLAPF